jgi:hypothetical protein
MASSRPPGDCDEREVEHKRESPTDGDCIAKLSRAEDCRLWQDADSLRCKRVLVTDGRNLHVDASEEWSGRCFEDGVSPFLLAMGALPATAVVVLCFLLIR